MLCRVIAGGVVSYGDYHFQSNDNHLYQVSTLNALSSGSYLNNFTAGELKREGDTGTFNHLDGEMVMKNGVVYQVKYSGDVIKVEDGMRVPIAMVTDFEKEEVLLISDSNYNEVKITLNKFVETEDSFFAIKIIGTFNFIQMRSFPAQKEPFPPLEEVIEHQSIFNHRHINGTLIGFFCPPWYSLINQPGYHFHFISGDDKIGGHVLSFDLNKGLGELDKMDQVKINYIT